ncbi:MAG: hypothetical protein AAB573_00305 [Patescibacteria group bacterium]
MAWRKGDLVVLNRAESDFLDVLLRRVPNCIDPKKMARDARKYIARTNPKLKGLSIPERRRRHVHPPVKML